MGVWRKILRAILEDDGTPSMFFGLVSNGHIPDHPRRLVNHSAESHSPKAGAAPKSLKRK
jgi:hypothetical protein